MITKPLLLLLVLLQLACVNGSVHTITKTTGINDDRTIKFKKDFNPNYAYEIYTINDGTKARNNFEYHTFEEGHLAFIGEGKKKVEKQIIGNTQKELWTRKYKSSPKTTTDFKVLQFNMLANGLSGFYDGEGSEKMFDHMDKAKLNWESRGKQIIEEIVRSGADVIVIEENDKFDAIYTALNQEGRTFEGIMMNKNDSPTQNLNNNDVVQGLLANGTLKHPLAADGVSIYWNTKTFQYTGKTLKEYLQLNKQRIEQGLPFDDAKDKNEIVKKMDQLKNGAQELIDLKVKKTKNGKHTIYTRVLKTKQQNDVISNEFPKELNEDGLKVTVERNKMVFDEKTNQNKEQDIYTFNGKEIKEPKEVYLAIKLQHIKSKQNMVFVATHLKSEKAQIGETTRLYEAKYLMKQVQENFTENLPIIFCADMNAGHVPLKVGTKPIYKPETYDYLTKTFGFEDSQHQLMRTDKYNHWTTAKVRGGEAAIMVEDYILYKNPSTSNQKKEVSTLAPVGYFSYPNLDAMSPLFLPNTYYPSDHVAILTGFNVTTAQKKVTQYRKNMALTGAGATMLAVFLTMFVASLLGYMQLPNMHIEDLFSYLLNLFKWNTSPNGPSGEHQE